MQYGLTNTTNLPTWARNEANRYSFSSGIRKISPNGWAKLFMMSAAMGKATIHDYVVRDAFEGLPYSTFTLNSAAPAVAPNTVQTLDVVDSSRVIPNQIHMMASGERLFVISVAGNQVTVKRGMGMTAPALLPAGSSSFKVDDAFEEGSLRPMGMSSTPTMLENYTQIFRHTWSQTGSSVAIVNMFGQTFDTSLREHALNLHATSIEMALLMGEKSYATHKGQRLSTMDGVIAQIKRNAPQNVLQAPNVVTYSWLAKATRKLFDITYNPGESTGRTVYVDSTALMALQELGRNYGMVMTDPATNVFGSIFTMFRTPNGTFVIQEHPLLTWLSSVFPDRAGQMLILDLAALKYGTHPKRDGWPAGFNMGKGGLADTDGDAVDNGIDARGETYTTECSNLLLAPAACAYITGFIHAGCEPCLVQQTWSACLTVDKPCLAGEIAPNSSVKVTISGGKPSVTVKISTRTGIKDVALDAEGNGSFNFTVGSDPTYEFAALHDSANTDLGWSQAVATVCVTQPCDPTAVRDPSSGLVSGSAC